MLTLLVNDAAQADRARHLAMLIQAASAARAEALTTATVARGSAQAEAMASATRHERERDQCARELGLLLAAHIDAGPGGFR